MSERIEVFIYKFKNASAARWLDVDPILGPAEPGYEIDTGQLKVGNGVNTWSELPYLVDPDAINLLVTQLVNAQLSELEEIKGPKGDPGEDASWVTMTQAEYDALPTKDPLTLYLIVPVP